MYCQECGTQYTDDVIFCSKCGTNVKVDNSIWTSLWMSRISTFFGAIALLAAIIGWRWYFESRDPLVFFAEFFGLLIGISLFLFGLFPKKACKKLSIDTKDKYTAIIIILIILWFIITGIEPEPPQGWWNY